MKLKLSKQQIVFTGILFLFFCYYLLWAFLLKFNSNPDELMRYMIPKYIYKHGSLPTGYDKEVVYFLGNWSYAFYPQMLGGIISAFFMKIIEFILGSKYLVFAARITSVIFGCISVAFVGLTIKKIKSDFKYVICGMLFIGFLPQFTYLSSYVNNDILAVAGVSIIVYALVAGTYNNNIWNYGSVVTLSIGFIFCILGYLNSLGFVLSGGIAFLMSVILQCKAKQISKRDALLFILTLILLTTIICLPFYIRNFIIYKGDFFGMSTFHNQYTKWLQNGGKALQFPYKNSAGFLSFLNNEQFWFTTFESFVGLFGYLNVRLSSRLYIIYLIIFYTGILGVFIKKHDNLKRNKLVIFFLVMGIILTVAAFAYYALFVDTQPQGRYLMEILPLLAIWSAIGLINVLEKIFKHTKFAIFIFFLLYICLNIYILIRIVYPNIMS